MTRATAAALAALILQPVLADDVLLAAEYREYSRLERLVDQWQQRTGHQVVWLPRESDRDVASPDLYYLPVQQMRALIEEGRVAAHPRPEQALAPAALLAEPFIERDGQGNILYRAVPQSVSVSLLWYRQDQVRAAGLQVEDIADWDGIEDMAIRLNDAIAGVRGFCPPGAEMHGLMVRAMIAAAGGTWQKPQPQPALADDWIAALERYARLLAAGGPADSGELSRADAERLFAQGKCALLLAGQQPPVPADEQAEMAALALPGAFATAWPSLRLLAVAEDSESVDAALSFLWFASTGRNPSPDAVVAEKAVAPSATAQAALRASLRQTAAAEVGSAAVAQLDDLARDGIGRAIAGLQPAAEALAAAIDP